MLGPLAGAGPAVVILMDSTTMPLVGGGGAWSTEVEVAARGMEQGIRAHGVSVDIVPAAGAAPDLVAGASAVVVVSTASDEGGLPITLQQTLQACTPPSSHAGVYGICVGACTAVPPVLQSWATARGARWCMSLCAGQHIGGVQWRQACVELGGVVAACATAAAPTAVPQ